MQCICRDPSNDKKVTLKKIERLFKTFPKKKGKEPLKSEEGFRNEFIMVPFKSLKKSKDKFKSKILGLKKGDNFHFYLIFKTK